MVRPEKYVNAPGISQSDITAFEKNIHQFYTEVILGGEREERKSDALDLGSIIDNILIDKENLKNYYVMAEFDASPSEKKVVEKVVDLIVDKIKVDIENKKAKPDALDMAKWPAITEFKAEIEKAIEITEYQKNWKLETRIEKIKNNGAVYFTELKAANGKYIVTLEIWNAAHTILEQIKEDPTTVGIFNMIQGNLTDAQKKRYKVHKGSDFYMVDPVTGMEVKGLLDFFVEDTKDKVIFPYDIKTSKSLPQFLSNYRLSRYGRQGAVYTDLIKTKFPDYKVNQFTFLVIPTKSGEAPEKFEMSESELIANRDGAESAAGYRVKGYRELLAEIKWHTENNKWLHHKEYYEKGKNIISGNLNVDPALLVDADEVVF